MTRIGRRSRRAICGGLALAATAAAHEDPHAAAGLEPSPLGSFALTPTIDLGLVPVPVEVPEGLAGDFPEGVALNLPSGFSVRLFGLIPGGRPRLMAVSPEGVLHVADMQGGRTKTSKRSRVVAMPDRDGDGFADAAVAVATDLSYANSLAFYRGDLYVAETHQVVKLVDGDGDGFYETHQVVLADLPDIPDNGFHGTRTLVFDEVNDGMFVSVGSPCDLCRQDDPRLGDNTTPIRASPEWGTIVQARSDGSQRRVYATGVRNAVGLDLHPLTNELWATHNHWDYGGPHLPPEWVDVVRERDFMGYPFVYGFRAWVDFAIPQYQFMLPITSADSLLASRQRRPAALVPAHLAPIGIRFYRGDLFPERYRNAALVALRGGQVSGNLAAVPGFKVVAVFADPDGANARVADFVTGFGPPHRADVFAKPVGLTTDAAGNLYISSDHGSPAVFRVEHSPLVATWDPHLPAAVVSGVSLPVKLTVHIERLADTGQTPRVTADLTAFGGPAALPLAPAGPGQFELDATVDVAPPNGSRSLAVWAEQGPYRIRLVWPITVLPPHDLLVFAAGGEPTWAVVPNSRLATDPAAPPRTREGRQTAAFAAAPSGLSTWALELVAPEPVVPEGYQSLRLAFHPGTLDPSGTVLNLAVNRTATTRSRSINLLEGTLDRPGVDLAVKEWQVVDIPLAALELSAPIAVIRLFGNLRGTFYLDDVRLVTQARPGTGTAVAEEYTASTPVGFDLGQNYPNPFNSSTVVRFSLARSGPVHLAVFNAAGQRVARLVEGERAGGLYSVRWDGVDDEGQRLGTGVYLYALEAGGSVQTRKLLILR